MTNNNSFQHNNLREQLKITFHGKINHKFSFSREIHKSIQQQEIINKQNPSLKTKNP